MDIEIERIKPDGKLDEVFAIRESLFGNGEDELDECAISVLLKADGQNAAIGRILLDLESDRLIIDHVGVLEEFRGHGLSEKILDEFVAIANESDTGILWAKSRGERNAITYYEHFCFEVENYYWMTLDLKAIQEAMQ